MATLKGKIAISSGQPGSGGWIQFPGGAFTADPKSSVTVPGGGYGYGLAWNDATKSWVAVNWYMIRQDGQVYAYTQWDYSGMRVWIARRNGTTDPLAPLPQGDNSYAVLSAEPEGVYVSAQQGQGGMWLLDYTGKSRQVSATGFWQQAAFGYAYGTITPYVPQGATNVIRQMNLKTGAVVDWFSQPGMQSRVVGTTITGVPIIEASSATIAEVWLGTQTPKLLHSQPVIKSPNPYYGYQQQLAVYAITALGDQVGIWVATTGGLYLYTDKAGWELASSTTGMLGSTIQ